MRLNDWLCILRSSFIQRRAQPRMSRMDGFVGPRRGRTSAQIEHLEQRTLLTAPNPVDLGSLNPSSTNPAGFRVNGAETSAGVGESISRVGDINGDGFEDFVLTGPGVDSSGDAYVVFGNPGSFSATLSVDDLTGDNGFRVDDVGEVPIASDLGDVNGDGFSDFGLASGTPYQSGGSVWVIFGRASFGTSLDLSALDGSDGFRLDDSGGTNSVNSLSAAGDFNGAGLDDVIVGAPSVTYEQAGRAYVVFGKASGFNPAINLDSLTTSDGFRMFSNATRAGYAGTSVAGAADINGDGFDDVVVGDYYDDQGRAYVVFGRSAAVTAPIDLTTLSSADGFRIVGDYVGRVVDTLGDINGDGFADLIATASYASAGGKYSVGEAYVIFGQSEPVTNPISVASLNGSDGFRIPGDNSYDYIGKAASGVGDINGDGLDDILIGAPNAEYNSSNEVQIGTGRAYVLFGQTTDFPADVNLRITTESNPDATAYLDGENGFRLDGEVRGDYAGQAVSGAGDINGDGFEDLLIGAPKVNVGLNFTVGTGYVVFGGGFTAGSETQIGTDSGSSKSDTLNATRGATSVDRLIGGQGDDVLNADGGADVLIGGQGNDVLGIATGNIGTAYRFDGGTGVDTLKLGGSAAFSGNLDLTKIADSRIVDIEGIDLRGEGANTLTLNVSEVLNISGTSNELRVRLDVVDTVNVGSGWTGGGGTTVDGVQYQLLTQGQARLLIEALVEVTVPAASVGEESSGSLVYTFARTGSTGDVTLNFSVAGSAALTTDYTVSGADSFSGGTGTVTIADGESSATVSLTAVSDTVVEGDENVVMTLTAAPGYTIGSADTAIGIFDDNDTAVVAFDAVTSSLSESDGTQNVAVRLTITANGQANSGTLASPLTVNVADLQTGSAGSSDFIFNSPAQVMFNTTSETKNVGVVIEDDAIEEASETISLGLGGLSNSINGSVSIDESRDTHTITIRDNDGSGSLQTELRIAHVATATDGNGEATVLPPNADFLDEWDEFFLEVWGKVTESTSGVDTAHIEIPYQSNFYTVDAVAFGASFEGNSGSSVDNTPGNGRITLDLDTARTDAGVDTFVLFARVSLSVQVELPNNLLNQYVSPTIDDRFDAENITVALSGGGTATALNVSGLTTEIWPVLYDLDDDGSIGFGDLPALAAVFSTTTSGNPSAFRADFDRGGSVDFADISLFASNLGRSISSTGGQIYAPDFHTGGSTLLATSEVAPSESPVPVVDNEDANQLKTAAIQQFESAGLDDTSVTELQSVEVVIRDLPGQQLGLAAGNRIFVDVNAAGAGWFVDSTPQDSTEFQSGAEGSDVAHRYDLLTVIAHELGHILGLTHQHDGGLMEHTLETGIRREVTAHDLDSLYTGFDGLGDLL